MLTAILNPQADRGRTAALAASLQQALGDRVELRLLQTTRRGEAVDLSREAGAAGSAAVIAIGGDGTVHEVVNGLMALAEDRRPALGIIPAGSGNDFAFALGITKDLARSAVMIEQGFTRAVDVGHIAAGGGGTRYSINNIGALLEGQVNLASHELAWPKGSGLYLRALLETLLHRPPVAQLQLRRDGEELVREAMILSISNGCRSGGRFHLMPGAKIDDGRFDYILAPRASRVRLLWEISKSLRAARPRDEWVEQGEFAELTVRSDVPLAVHVDGEPWLRPDENERELTIKVLPRTLRVLCDEVAS